MAGSDLSKVLLSDGEEYWTYHRLKDIMGSMIGGAHNEVGVLFETDHTEALMDWCRRCPEVAAEMLKEHKFEEVRLWSARMAAYLKGEMEKDN